MAKADKALIIKCDGLQTLINVLIERDYVPVGPTVRDGVIVYDQLR